MSIRALSLLVLLILATWPLVAASTPDTTPTTRKAFSAKELSQGYRDDVVIAKPRAELDAQLLAERENRQGFGRERIWSRFGDMRVLRLPEGIEPAAAITQLRATGLYEFVEPDGIHRSQVIPNDPDFGKQWSLLNQGQSSGTPGADIDATTAWDLQREAPQVIVAIVDSGVRLTHQDIAPNLWTNPGEIAGNGQDDDGNGYIDDVHGINAIESKSSSKAGDPSDGSGHGTHVAGIIGAAGNNGFGISGVAWKVRLMPLRFLGESGTGSTSNAIECMDYARAMGAHLINASYGSDSVVGSQAEYNAIKSLRDSGIIVVAAAGNESENLDETNHFPACYPLPNVISVASSTTLEDPASTTSYGEGLCELFAPGDSIYSLGHSSDSAMATKGGTSMAAPHVTGALALLKARFPQDSYRQLINRLLRGVDPITKYDPLCQTGGRLNVAGSLAASSNRPFNDDFSSRPRLSSANVALRTSNEGASLEAGEPAHAGLSSAHSLWFEWKSGAGGAVTVDTKGSDFDTLLAVYTGTALGSLTPVASSDNDSGLQTSSLSFTSMAGQSYQIAVAAKAFGAPGLVMLNIGTVAANDAFAQAQALSGQSLTATGTTANASREGSEPQILGKTGGRSLWYRWTAPRSGTFQVAADASGFDTLLAVYSGNSLGTLRLISANDNAEGPGATTNSLCSFVAEEGVEYRIVVDAADSSLTGAFRLTLVDSVWQQTLTEAVTNGPAVGADGSVYVGAVSGSFFAFSKDGSLLWKYSLGSGGMDSSTPTIAEDGTVLFPSSDGYLYALTPGTGSATLRWRAALGASSSPVALGSEGSVYAKGDDDSLYALSLADGTVKWKRTASSSNTYSGPVVGLDGTVYVGGEKAVFEAVNPQDGSLKWSFAADNPIYTSAALDAAGNLYFATTAGTLYSLKPDGGLRWSFRAGGAITSSPAIGPDGSVYFASYDSLLYALNGNNGKERWTYALGSEVRASSPAIAEDGTIYIGSYDNFLYAISSSGTLLRTYATGGWVRSAPVLAGSRLYVGSNDSKLYAFDVTSGPASGLWPMKGRDPRRSGRAVAVEPTISTQPQNTTVLVGSPFTLFVEITGSATSFQWFKDGAPIANATDRSYGKSSASDEDAGSYTVTVTTSTGQILRSTVATLVVEARRKGRLLGLSARGPVGAGDDVLIAGVVVTGGINGTQKPLILRALGPLISSVVGDAIPNPMLSLFSETQTLLLENRDWGDSAELSQVFLNRGLQVPSAQGGEAACLHVTGNSAVRTVHVRDEGGVEGVALAEIYDYDLEQPGNPARDGQGRLLGISARARVTGGERVLIGGFRIDGNVPLRILLRARGPGLPEQVSGRMQNPKIELYNSSGVLLATNDDWNGDPLVTTATVAVPGLQALEPGSRDAALVAYLKDGAYTAVVSGVNGTTGVALVEIYETGE